MSGMTEGRQKKNPDQVKNSLSIERLMRHIRALIEIGPRKPGSAAEARAQSYIRLQLADGGTVPREERFRLPLFGFSSLAHYAIAAMLLDIMLFFYFNNGFRWAMVSISVIFIHTIWRQYAGGANRLSAMTPAFESRHQLVRLNGPENPSRRLVLIARTSTARRIHPLLLNLKRWRRWQWTLFPLVLGINGLAQLFLIFGFWEIGTAVMSGCILALGGICLNLLRIAACGYQSGANTDAAAVSCLIELARFCNSEPLINTELYVLFTSAEPLRNEGIHHFLDSNAVLPHDTLVLDLQMCGAGAIGYAVSSDGLSHLNRQTTNPALLAIAQEAAKNCTKPVRPCHSPLAGPGSAIVARGFQSISLVGLGTDGWPVNWRSRADTVAAIEPQNLLTSAEFAIELIRVWDKMP